MALPMSTADTLDAICKQYGGKFYRQKIGDESLLSLELPGPNTTTVRAKTMVECVEQLLAKFPLAAVLGVGQ